MKSRERRLSNTGKRYLESVGTWQRRVALACLTHQAFHLRNPRPLGNRYPRAFGHPRQVATQDYDPLGSTRSLLGDESRCSVRPHVSALHDNPFQFCCITRPSALPYPVSHRLSALAPSVMMASDFNRLDPYVRTMINHASLKRG